MGEELTTYTRAMRIARRPFFHHFQTETLTTWSQAKYFYFDNRLVTRCYSLFTILYRILMAHINWTVHVTGVRWIACTDEPSRVPKIAGITRLLASTVPKSSTLSQLKSVLIAENFPRLRPRLRNYYNCPHPFC